MLGNSGQADISNFGELDTRKDDVDKQKAENRVHDPLFWVYDRLKDGKLGDDLYNLKSQEAVVINHLVSLLSQQAQGWEKRAYELMLEHVKESFKLIWINVSLFIPFPLLSVKKLNITRNQA